MLQERSAGESGGKRRPQAWSGSGKLANGIAERAVNMAADFEIPGEYTVQFTITPINNVAQICVAEVVWSVAGNNIQRLVSVVNGMSITGIGQGVRVKAFDMSAVGGGPVEYDVSISCARGGRASQSMPPVLGMVGDATGQLARATVPRVIIAGAGTTATFNIPDNSGVNSLFLSVSEDNGTAGAPLTTEEVTIEMFGGLNGGGVAVQKVNYDGCNEWIPLAPGTRSIVITNGRANPVDTIRASVTWGVDG